MSDQIDYASTSSKTTEKFLPTLTFGLLLLGCSIATLYMSVHFAGLGLHFTMFGGAVGLAAVGIFSLILRATLRTPDEIALEVFDRSTSIDPNPCILSDEHGSCKSVNHAVRLSELDARAPSVAHILREITDDAEPLVYRLLKAVRGFGRGSERVQATGGMWWAISCTEVADNRIIWRLEQSSALVNAEQGYHNQTNACPVLRINADETVVWANEAVQHLIGGMPAVLSDVVADQHDNFANLNSKNSDHAPVRLVKSHLDDGQIEIVIVEEHQQDVAHDASDVFFDALPVAIARVDTQGRIVHANEGVRDLLGDGAKAGALLEDLMEGLGRSMAERVLDTLKGRSHMRSEVARAHVDGQEIYLQVTLKRANFSGQPSLLAVISDATELKTLEAQFVQSQKMQAVGQLAGGVAHDFNNLLTAINGHCDLLLMRHAQGDADHGDLIQVRQNANRAASLVGQLLAFSRKQTLLPKVLDLYTTLTELSHLLNRLLGEKVDLKIDHAKDLNHVRADERQFEQVIMNLVVNARDAMPHGGEVRIKTRNVEFEQDFTKDRAVVPFGDYVRIDVVDTGHGIPQDKIKKIFEPFFTTKAQGEGTGLGLSTVYGIIKQTGGFIFAESTVGKGTCFTIYLPVNAEHDRAVEVEQPRQEPATELDLSGNGVVLLVEDELPVRSFAARALDIRGYTVIEAASAEEALDILEDRDLHIDIFVSDVIMPGMDGPTWVKKARLDRPETKVIFVSGYAEDAFEGGEVRMDNAAFLPKPFSLNELTQTVKEQISA